MDGPFRRLPCLTPPPRNCASRNSPTTLRAPQNCEELRVYLENVRLLERISEEEWRNLQPLVDLAQSGVWQWRRDVQLPLLSRLFRLSGTVFTPEGLCVYPHALETVVNILPRDPTNLSQYLNSVVHHNLLPPQQQQAFRYLFNVVARPIWEWNEVPH